MDLATIRSRVDWTKYPNDPMFNENIEHYEGVGESAIRVVNAAIELAKRPSPSSILDFGCATGRVSRWFKAAYPDADLHVSDINYEQMNWTANTFDATALPSEDDFRDVHPKRKFDLIWSGSVATHTSEFDTETLFRCALDWLEPGGLAVITLHGRQFIRYAVSRYLKYFPDDREIEDILEQIAATGYGFSPHPGMTQGISANSAEWAVRLGNRLGARTILFGEHLWDDHHDVLALQKPL